MVIKDVMSGGLPPHQAAFLYDGIPVLLVGIVPDESGMYWSWTLFSDSFKPRYYRKIIRYCNLYRTHLEFGQIYHIISKTRPWTRRMARAFGFIYSHNIDDANEMWVI